VFRGLARGGDGGNQVTDRRPLGHCFGECFDVMAAQEQPGRCPGAARRGRLNVGEQPHRCVEVGVQAALEDLAELPVHVRHVPAGIGHGARGETHVPFVPLQSPFDVLDCVPADQGIRHQPGEIGSLLSTGRRPQCRVGDDCRLGPPDKRADLVPAAAAPHHPGDVAGVHATDIGRYGLRVGVSPPGDDGGELTRAPPLVNDPAVFPGGFAAGRWQH